MAYGYRGKVLRVNLSNSAISTDQPDENFYRIYFGGSNLVAYHLLKELRPGIEPLGAENKLVFACGVVTGAPVGGSGRNSVGAKSPLTGAFGDAQVGGYWGAELKRAGYDGVVVEGKAERPVYIWIKDGQAEIRDARQLWGKTTGEAQALIRQETGDSVVRTALIGPAGEKLVRFASIMNDVNRAAGRTGLGAVMGSKNLKGIAVRGNDPVPVKDAEAVAKLAKWLADTVMTDNRGMRDQGTPSALFALNRSGGLPTRNFREGVFPEGVGKIDGRTYRDTILIARRSCWACPVRCKREVKVDKPYKVDPLYGGPEYETLASLGSNCGINSLEAVAKGNELCAAYGLDTISTGVAISFAMECFEKGILTGKDCDGLELTFGNADVMLKMVEKIGRREGLGTVLGEGVARAARSIGKGAEQYAMHIKGQEVPMHEPRYKHALGLGYTVSPTGADHCHNMHDNLFSGPSADLEDYKTLGVLEPLDVKDLSPAKVRLFIYYHEWRHFLNCAVVCQFPHFDIRKWTQVVEGVTGWNTSVWELMKVGQRSVNMARAFNIREGFTKKDDYLPQRFLVAFAGGPLQGVAVDAAKLEQAKEVYYRMMGWDPVKGAPTRETLAELGIGWVADLLK